MTLIVNVNTMSKEAQRSLNTTQGRLETALQRLGSGQRINSAKDDAAGLAIASRFTSQINGDTRASLNANDAISMAQTAEGGLGTAGDLLQRIRTLALQSANGINSSADRANMQGEAAALTAELNRVATTTQFNGQNVIDGSLTSVQFQIGANANQTLNIGIGSAKPSDLGNNTVQSISAANNGTPGTDPAASISAAVAGDANQVAQQTLTITSLAGVTNKINLQAGASAAAIAASVNALSSQSGVTAAATSGATIDGIADGPVQFQLRGANSLAKQPNSTPVTISADVANGDLSTLAQAINAQSGTTHISASVRQSQGGAKTLVLNNSDGDDIQIANLTTGSGLDGATITGGDGSPALGGAAAIPGSAVAIGPGTAAAPAAVTVGGQVSFSSDSGFSITSTDATNSLLYAGAGGTGAAGSTLQSMQSLDISSIAGANAALLTIDAALNQINTGRAQLGALQNRFSEVASSLGHNSNILEGPRGRIQDTDFAAETADLTRDQVLQQAGTAMLAQANALPNAVLTLMRN